MQSSEGLEIDHSNINLTDYMPKESEVYLAIVNKEHNDRIIS